MNWFQNISSSSWQNIWSVVSALIGSVATILGVILTFKYQRNKDMEDRKDKIKPIIFARLTNTESETSDETNGVYQYFQLLGSIGMIEQFKATNLEFTIYVQGDYPAKDIHFTRFEVTEENNQLFNFGSDVVERSILEPKSEEKQLWNFSPIQTNIDWKREPLAVFRNDSEKMQISVFGGKANLHQFLSAFWNLPQELFSKYFSDFIPVTAKFKYQDIDNNTYEDLSVSFFVGLTLEDEYVVPIITQSSPFVDNPLTEKFIKYQVDRQMKEVEKT